MSERNAEFRATLRSRAQVTGFFGGLELVRRASCISRSGALVPSGGSSPGRAVVASPASPALDRPGSPLARVGLVAAPRRSPVTGSVFIDIGMQKDQARGVRRRLVIEWVAQLGGHGLDPADATGPASWGKAGAGKAGAGKTGAGKTGAGEGGRRESGRGEDGRRGRSGAGKAGAGKTGAGEGRRGEGGRRGRQIAAGRGGAAVPRPLGVGPVTRMAAEPGRAAAPDRPAPASRTAAPDRPPPYRAPPRPDRAAPPQRRRRRDAHRRPAGAVAWPGNQVPLVLR